MHVFDFSPINESRKTCVNLDARNGKCAPLRPRARMHSFKAKSDLLISAPSIPVGGKRPKILDRILVVPIRYTYEFGDWRKRCRHHARYQLNRPERIFHEDGSEQHAVGE